MNIEELKIYPLILVIGHNKPDPDSMISSKLMTDILKDYGINANYALLECNLKDLQIDKIVEECLDYKPFIVKTEDISKYKYFLVDHNDISQSVKISSLVVGGIDHHPNSKSTENIVFMETCSTAEAIYVLFKNQYNFNQEQKKQIYHATLDDSSYGKNARYKDYDKQIIEELGFNSDFSDAFLKYFIPTDLSDLEYAFRSTNYKKFTFNEVKFESTCIETFNTKYKDEFKNFIKNNEKHMLGMWIDYSNNITYTFFKYNNLYNEEKYPIVAPRSSIVLNDTLDFLRRNGFNV